MCSQTGGNQYPEFLTTKDWTISEDVDLDEAESINSARVGKTGRPTPNPFVRTRWKSERVVREPEKINTIERRLNSEHVVREPAKINTIEKAKTERSTSLEDKMKKWHRSSLPSRKAERTANQYTELVQGDSLEHLRKSIRIAGSISKKGTDINKELRRQQHVIHRADSDIRLADCDTDQTNEKLRRMSSSWKRATSIRKGKTKKVQTSKNPDILRTGISSYSMSKVCSTKAITRSRGSSKDTKQQQINSGIEELHTVLDLITVQQMDATWMLKEQEKQLSVFEDRTDRTHTKIKRQSQIISRIVGKS